MITTTVTTAILTPLDTGFRVSALLKELAPYLTSSPEQQKRTLSDPSNTVLGAFQYGIMVGILTITTVDLFYRRTSWINDVVVDPNYRKHGIGTQLLREAKAIAKALRSEVIMLSSGEHRTDAHLLYLREGFVPLGSTLYEVRI